METSFLFWKGLGCLGFVFVSEQARQELFWVYSLLRDSFPLTRSLAHSRERVDQVVREKEKLRSDLDKAEKLKSLMASEVDDHHAAIERRNEYNLRCDWIGPGPSFPSTLAQGIGAQPAACMATPSWRDGGVVKPQGKQDTFDTSRSFLSLRLCVSIFWWIRTGPLRGLTAAHWSFPLTGNWTKSTRNG